jgi:hypothetical protein
MKRTFKPGEAVYHLRLGLGVAVEEWGAWIDVDDRGNQLAVNGVGIFEIQFENGRKRSINADWLQPKNIQRAPLFGRSWNQS